MIDFLILVFSGAFVGFAIGLTGVGGGSLMTPILLLIGYPAPVAIGTDLLYAAITKGSGVYFHHLKNNIQWRAMFLLAAGSIPVSLALTLLVLNEEVRANEHYESVLTSALGIMLILTSMVIAFRRQIQQRLQSGPGTRKVPGFAATHSSIATFVLGMVLGLCVTLTSVGAGAVGAAILFLLYPGWSASKVIGTDIAHAVPLTLVAGLGYLANGLVDLTLLLSLLIGSLPGIYMGTHVGSLFPDRVMRAILIVALLLLGGYFSILH